MVAQDYGITLLPEMFTKQGLLPKNVKAFPFQSPVPTRKIGAAWREKDPLEADIKAITAEMKRILPH
jgi:LysR family hydrogen peroxide-inducible transcriptional activator